MIGILSLTAMGISGSIYAMLSHGLTTGGLFLGIGVLYERRHTRRLSEYGGIWKQMPIFAGLYLIVVMGSAGLPALSGFIGEFLTIFGTFISGDTMPAGYHLPVPRLLGALSATGVILGAVYLLFMFQKVFFGKLDKSRNGGLPDLRAHELVVFVILSITILLGGLFPRPLLAVMEPSVQKFTRDFAKRVAEPDGPAHVFGSPPPSAQPSQPAQAAQPVQPTPPTPVPVPTDEDERAGTPRVVVVPNGAGSAAAPPPPPPVPPAAAPTPAGGVK
jgi:NADH-quinone oxidoreductase subunit M